MAWRSKIAKGDKRLVLPILFQKRKQENPWQYPEQITRFERIQNYNKEYGFSMRQKSNKI